MGSMTETNQGLVEKYRLDNVLLESYFRDSKNVQVKGAVYPARIDNRHLCSPTDYQGDKPSCCGYTSAQILEALNWMETGRLTQFDADQIYAKAKETDKAMGKGGTYPDLAMQKGLEIAPRWIRDSFAVKTSKDTSPDALKRAVHQNMFVSCNVTVWGDLYDLDSANFVYSGRGRKLGSHSLVCCGYDDAAQMFIMQNHWGTKWGLKGFFLFPFRVWQNSSPLLCWYERRPGQTQRDLDPTRGKVDVADSTGSDLA